VARAHAPAWLLPPRPPPPPSNRHHWFFTVSPDACSNPVLYWLGCYAGGRFDLASAAGPFRLDLGDVLYAPNIMADGGGRQLLWGWLQVGGPGLGAGGGGKKAEAEAEAGVGALARAGCPCAAGTASPGQRMSALTGLSTYRLAARGR
jgi:hypothetical protein